MALHNEISISFTEEELQQADDAIKKLENIFGPKLIQLTPEQNKFYGKVGNETGNWIKMVHTDAQAAPDLVPTKVVDMNEWNKDDMAREQILPRLNRLNSLANNLSSTNRVIGFDLYNNSLSTYNNVKYEASQNVPGTQFYIDKWKIQFPGHGGGRPKTVPAAEAVK